MGNSNFFQQREIRDEAHSFRRVRGDGSKAVAGFIEAYISKQGLTQAAVAAAWDIPASEMSRICSGLRPLPIEKVFQVLRDLRLEGDDVVLFLRSSGGDVILGEVAETCRQAGAASPLAREWKMVWSPPAVQRAVERQDVEERAIVRAITELRRRSDQVEILDEHMLTWRKQVSSARASAEQGHHRAAASKMYEAFVSDVAFHLGIGSLSEGGSFKVGLKREDVTRFSPTQRAIWETVRDHYELPPTQEGRQGKESGRTYDPSYGVVEEAMSLELHEEIAGAIKRGIRTGDTSTAVETIKRHGSWHSYPRSFPFRAV